MQQALYPVAQTAKVPLLLELLRRGEVGNAIVFTRTKHRANRVAQKLDRQGVAVERIHGNRSQKQRTSALEGFRKGRFQVLVATDILARGIDVEALEHVVNFDVPVTPDDYIHRVGRTGRAEATGDAYTFVTPEDHDLVRAIERKVGRPIERRTLPDFDYGTTPDEPLEIPLEQRLAKMRAERAESRRRAAAKPDGPTGNGNADGRGNGRGRKDANPHERGNGNRYGKNVGMRGRARRAPGRGGRESRS